MGGRGWMTQADVRGDECLRNGRPLLRCVTSLWSIRVGRALWMASILPCMRGSSLGFSARTARARARPSKILSTLLKKTSGNVTVAGHDVDHQAEQIRRSVGVAMQTAGLDDLAKAHDFLTLQGRLYGLRSSEARARSAELLDFVGLSSVADKKIGTFSGGMRRRLDLVATLVHRAQGVVSWMSRRPASIRRAA